MPETRQPTLYLVAGPNGAGKSSLAGSLLPQAVPAERFVNPDVIATALNPAHPDMALREAGKRALERVREFESVRRSFALETTLSGRWTTQLVDRLLAAGWHVDLSFLWLPTGDAAVARVQSRVERAGGHAIPAEVVRRRFDRGLLNLDLLRGDVTRWRLIDRRRVAGTGVIAEGEGASLIVHDAAAWDEVRRSIAAAWRRTDGDDQPQQVRESPSGFAGLAREARAEIDLAIAVADRATVLRHRSLEIPLVFCDDGRTTEVDPWTVALPGVAVLGKD